jgi:hypothetical protein
MSAGIPGVDYMMQNTFKEGERQNCIGPLATDECLQTLGACLYPGLPLPLDSLKSVDRHGILLPETPGVPLLPKLP